MQEFFVGNFRVDILRNQIVREGEVIALEPKVLEVLRLLAQHQGEVVSHQILLDTVWPDIVVAPNALQRCIGQLRKALNDDGKSQSVIVTHPKKGYSLVAEVTIRNTSALPMLPSVERSLPNYSLLKTSGIVLLLCLLIGGYWWHSDSETGFGSSELSPFVRLTPLTATDTSEFYSTFSPDGRYVAFSRSVQGKGGHLWLKDMTNNQEIQLTKTAGRYGQPNWSTDGKQLAFLNITACASGCDKEQCREVSRLYVPLALSEPQELTTMVPCESIPNQGLQWINDSEFAFIRLTNDASQIVVQNSQSAAQYILFETQKGSLYSLAFHAKNQQLAVMRESSMLSQSLFLLSLKNKQIMDIPFTHPARYSSHLRWYPIWNHSGDKLLFSAESRLYLMDMNGNLEDQVIPTFQDISRPMYHPNGQSIAMTLGKVDRDIAEISLLESSDNQQTSTYTEDKLARSILRETDAQYQPNGEKIAFFSQRTGGREVWLTGPDGIQQLSHFEHHIDPEYFVWAANGKQIAVLTENSIYLFDLKGNYEVINLNFRAARLYQWTDDNALLMSVVDTQGVKLISYDLQSGNNQTLYNGYIKWAQQDKKRVFITHQANNISELVESEIRPITALQEIESWSRFFIRENQLYILASDDNIWRFDLQKSTLELLFQYPDPSISLTDVSTDHMRMLISKQMSAKKEIVLLQP